MSDEIKMAVKKSPDGGVTPIVLHTGQMKQQPIVQVSKIGLQDVIIEKKEEIKKISITSIMLAELIDECAKDLLIKRKVNVDPMINPTGIESISFISSYDARNKILTFTNDVKYFNTVFKFKNSDLADLFSNFFFLNINKYSKDKYDAIPEILPMVSVEALSNNMVKIIVH